MIGDGDEARTVQRATSRETNVAFLLLLPIASAVWLLAKPKSLSRSAASGCLTAPLTWMQMWSS